MKKITVLIKSLSNKRLTGLLLAVEGINLVRPLKYSLDLQVQNATQLLEFINSHVIDIEIDDDNTIREVTQNTSIVNHRVDTNVLIQKIVDEHKEISKQEFYDKYCKIVGCVKRTAENHLAGALEKKVVTEKDYYTLMSVSNDVQKTTNN